MTSPNENASPHLEIIPASAQDELVLANLFQLYIHDFCDLIEIQIGDDGRFEYPALSPYWNEPGSSGSGRSAFLIKVDGSLAGFVLVWQQYPIENGIEPPFRTQDIQEFFVLRTYRRRGVGKFTAHAIWHRFPGPWQVRVRQSNTSASRFWSKTIAEFTGKSIDPNHVETDGQPWEIYSFRSLPVN